MSLVTNQEYELRSGRRVGVSLTGDPFADDLVAFCHPDGASGPFDPNPLATRESGVQLLSIDRPGYGGSESLGDDPASVELFADDLAEYAKDRGLVGARGPDGRPAKMAVVGWGFGGAVALAAAARHPDLVRSVVTVATREPTRLARLDVGPMRETEDADWTALERIAPGIGGRVHRLHDESAAGNEADRWAMRDVSWSDRLSDITAPVALVYGTRDEIATRKDGRAYQRRIPGSRVVMVRDAGPLAIVNVWAQVLSRIGS